MRKREKSLYIAGIATLVAVFTLGTRSTDSTTHTAQQDSIPVVADTVVHSFRISPYDSLFRAYADTIGWDWKMLAAVAYVESKFDTAATSNVGAQGLMQMMPQTARAMGVPEGERRYFVLASYNAGFGHIQDAMRLAEKYGKNRYVWNENVETFLRLKNDSIYYTDSLCRNGRFTGIETTLFVRKVQHKYSEYCLREEQYWETHRDTTHYVPRPGFCIFDEDIASETTSADSTQHPMALL